MTRVMFVWQVDGVTRKAAAVVPEVPIPGDRVIPPGEANFMNVRAREWDCRTGTESRVYVALE